MMKSHVIIRGSPEGTVLVYGTVDEGRAVIIDQCQNSGLSTTLRYADRRNYVSQQQRLQVAITMPAMTRVAGGLL